MKIALILTGVLLLVIVAPMTIAYFHHYMGGREILNEIEMIEYLRRNEE